MLDIASQGLVFGGLIDIDLSYFIILVLFLILAVILNFILFKPILAVRDKREARTAGARKDAAEKQRQAEEAARSYETKIRQARSQGSEQRTVVRDEALRQHRDVVSTARQKAETDSSKRIEALNRDFEESAKPVDQSAKKLAQAIADRLMTAG